MACRIVASFLLLLFFTPRPCAAELGWQAQNSGLDDVDFRSVSAFFGEEALVCAASAKSAYLLKGQQTTWQKIFSLAGQDEEINFVSVDFSEPRRIYLATSKGLFFTQDRGRSWQRPFRKIKPEENDVRWVTSGVGNSGKIYIGTGESLYFSENAGADWKKADHGLPSAAVRAIAAHPSNTYVLYVANTYGLFKTIDGGDTWERIFVTTYRVGDKENAEGEGAEEEDEAARPGDWQQTLINCIAIDPGDTKKVYIATSRGAFGSVDAGAAWRKLPAAGLSSDWVNFIIISAEKNDNLYAATEEGVFCFSPERKSWREIYRGLSARRVRSLALTKGARGLWAATEGGMFRTVIRRQEQQRPPASLELDKKAEAPADLNLGAILQAVVRNEPTIRQVQEAALRYGEVIHPKQIRSLRQGARLKALLPDISLDYDKTIKDGGTTSNFGKFIIGPRDWSLSLSWDVGDLVFSEQLRLIDVNVRSAVQLRDDILDEVNRFYYERRRLQTELIVTPPQSTEEWLEKTFRLEELTANIDALTGGYFSRHLKKETVADN